MCSLAQNIAPSVETTCSLRSPQHPQLSPVLKQFNSLDVLTLQFNIIIRSRPFLTPSGLYTCRLKFLNSFLIFSNCATWPAHRIVLYLTMVLRLHSVRLLVIQFSLVLISFCILEETIKLNILSLKTMSLRNDNWFPYLVRNSNESKVVNLLPRAFVKANNTERCMSNEYSLTVCSHIFSQTVDTSS